MDDVHSPMSTNIELVDYYRFIAYTLLNGSCGKHSHIALVESSYKAGRTESSKPHSRLLEMICRQIPEPVPGIVLMLGNDTGPGLAYYARIFQETRIFALMPNRLIADDVQHFMRAEDLSQRVPVFSGDASKKESYRIVGSCPLAISKEFIRQQNEPKLVLSALSARMQKGALLIDGGFFLSTRTQSLDLVKGADLLPAVLWPSGLATLEEYSAITESQGFRIVANEDVTFMLQREGLPQHLQFLRNLRHWLVLSASIRDEAIAFKKGLYAALNSGLITYKLLSMEYEGL
jgi:hypothetical protein